MITPSSCSSQHSGVTVNASGVRIYTIRRRKDRRRRYEVRWQAAGRTRSKSFTRGLADSYRAELVRAARQGLEFDPDTGEPLPWSLPGQAAATWLEHAAAYADMKWPHLAPHSPASLADALATVTPALTWPTAWRAPARTLRAALYGHVFSSQRHARPMDPSEARAIEWLARASLPVRRLSEPQIVRGALDALTVRMDGSRAAAATVARKRAVFHEAFGLLRRTRTLPANPVSQVRWTAPTATTAVNVQAVASPAQVRAILAEVARLRPELTAFFGCLYYAALRPPPLPSASGIPPVTRYGLSRDTSSERDPGCLLVTDPAARRVMDLFNVCYEILLLAFQRFFAHTEESDAQLALADATMALMVQVVAPLGNLITALPAGPEYPGRTPGPSFGPRDHPVSTTRCAGAANRGTSRSAAACTGTPGSVTRCSAASRRCSSGRAAYPR